MKKEKKPEKPFICQECGQKLPSAGTYHPQNHCGQYHLMRAVQILGAKVVVQVTVLQFLEKKGERKGSP